MKSLEELIDKVQDKHKYIPVGECLRFGEELADEDAKKLLKYCLDISVGAELKGRDQYIVDKSNSTQLAKVLQILQQVPPYQTKGIALYGGVGVGKTMTAKAILEYYNAMDKRSIIVKSYEIKSMKEEEILSLTKKDVILIDDLGAEGEDKKVVYGTVIHPIEDMIMKIYERMGRKRLVITSNLSPTQISERYSDRMSDRLREMVQWIDMGKGSRR